MSSEKRWTDHDIRREQAAGFGVGLVLAGTLGLAGMALDIWGLPAGAVVGGLIVVLQIRRREP